MLVCPLREREGAARRSWRRQADKTAGGGRGGTQRNKKGGFSPLPLSPDGFSRRGVLFICAQPSAASLCAAERARSARTERDRREREGFCRLSMSCLLLVFLN